MRQTPRPIAKPTRSYRSMTPLSRSTYLVNGRGDLINPKRAIRRRLMTEYGLRTGRSWRRLRIYLTYNKPSELSRLG